MTTIDDFEDRFTGGLHVLALVQTESSPDPAWAAALDGLRDVLTAMRDGAVASNMPVHEHDIAELRRVRVFVDEWLATGRRPDGIALAHQLYFNLTRGNATMLETSAELTPTSGGRHRAITCRIGDVRRDGNGWSARVDILGFGEPSTVRVQGDTWARAIELAAQQVPVLLEERIRAAGGGTTDPPF